MLLQTNSYIVPKEKRSEHARLLRKFRQTLHRLGCDHFEVYEQVGTNWANAENTGRFVQIMRFRDRKHQQQVQSAEKQDPLAQQFIGEFCALINFPYQQQQGLFAASFYNSALPVLPARRGSAAPPVPPPPPLEPEDGTVPRVVVGTGTGLLDLTGFDPAANAPGSAPNQPTPASAGVPASDQHGVRAPEAFGQTPVDPESLLEIVEDKPPADAPLSEHERAAMLLDLADIPGKRSDDAPRGEAGPRSRQRR